MRLGAASTLARVTTASTFEPFLGGDLNRNGLEDRLLSGVSERAAEYVSWLARRGICSI